MNTRIILLFLFIGTISCSVKKIKRNSDTKNSNGCNLLIENVSGIVDFSNLDDSDFFKNNLDYFRDSISTGVFLYRRHPMIKNGIIKTISLENNQVYAKKNELLVSNDLILKNDERIKFLIKESSKAHVMQFCSKEISNHPDIYLMLVKRNNDIVISYKSFFGSPIPLKSIEKDKLNFGYEIFKFLNNNNSATN